MLPDLCAKEDMEHGQKREERRKVKLDQRYDSVSKDI